MGAAMVADAHLEKPQALSRANDLADPGVMTPGWTPVPMAVDAAIAILGAALVLAGAAES